MRRSDACHYQESRDGLATSWYDFLMAALPGSTWVGLPNRGVDVAKTVESLGLNGIILTGGETHGAHPQRDKTEMELISHGLQGGIPIFGVCRGMQMLCIYFGGNSITCSSEKHVAVRHTVRFEENPFALKGEQEVNSYHINMIKKESLPKKLHALALDSEGGVEGVYSKEHKLAGVMWHPERENPFAKSDIVFFRTFFK